MADPEDAPTGVPRDPAPAGTPTVPGPASGPGARHTPEQPYTVHVDAAEPTSGPAAPSRDPSREPSPGFFSEPSGEPSPEPGASSARRRGPDPVTLLAGLAALLVAASAMTGLLVDTDPRWVLAGGAVLVGGLVLLTSLRRT